MIVVPVVAALAWLTWGLWSASTIEGMPETSLVSRLGAVLTRDEVWMRVARATQVTREETHRHHNQ